MFCTNCGSPQPEGTKVCSACGRPIEIVGENMQGGYGSVPGENMQGGYGSVPRGNMQGSYGSVPGGNTQGGYGSAPGGNPQSGYGSAPGGNMQGGYGGSSQGSYRQAAPVNATAAASAIKDFVNRLDMDKLWLVLMTALAVYTLNEVISFVRFVASDPLAQILSLIISGARILLLFIMLRSKDYGNLFIPAIVFDISAVYSVISLLINLVRGTAYYGAMGAFNILVTIVLAVVATTRFLGILDLKLANMILGGLIAYRLVYVFIDFLTGLRYFTGWLLISVMASLCYWLIHLTFVLLFSRD